MFKGEPNKSGRPKGARNKLTTQAREIISDVLRDGKEQFLERLGTLNNRDFVRSYLDLLKLSVPTPKESELPDDGLPTEIEVHIVGRKEDVINKG